MRQIPHELPAKQLVAHPLSGRPPQSTQSVPEGHMVYSAPMPPSSQSPSDAYTHVFVHCIGRLGGWLTGGGGGGRGDGGGGDDAVADHHARGPQSAQSVPKSQREDVDLRPPSSHTPLET